MTQAGSYTYDFELLNKLFEEVLQNTVSAEAFSWLKDSLNANNPTRFNASFVSVPRKTGRELVPDISSQIQSLRPGLKLKFWTVDRLARVWLLMNLPAGDREKYFNTINNLFLAAEVNELVALYSSLPVLAYPEIWKARCTEGIRNNIADVLTAIMCNNPYPSENLDESAWNQMVLKAFFTDKNVDEIFGLDKRRNAKLAWTLSDYAHERWAADRSVNPQLWRCVGPFIDQSLLPDIERIINSPDELEREAAALACSESLYTPAKKLVPVELNNLIQNGQFSWTVLAKKIKDNVLQ